MNKISKLVSASLVTLLSFGVTEAKAEYYVVCNAPPPPTIVKYIYVKPSCHVVHAKHTYKPRHYHSRHVYKAPRNHASVSVYYIWNTQPVCSTCGTCGGGYACTACSPYEYCADGASYYYPSYYDSNFDFGGRTADDIGNDMNIDY